MAQTRLITATEVIDLAFTNSNTDVALIKDEIIDIAQETHLRPALTTDLFDEIILEFAGTFSANNQILFDDHIKPTLAFYVKFEALTDVSFNSGSLGIRQNIDNFSEPLSASQLSLYKTQIFRQATAKKDKMLRFILDDTSKFPKFEGKKDRFKKSGLFVTDNESLEKRVIIRSETLDKNINENC